jgi:hypothetical protein
VSASTTNAKNPGPEPERPVTAFKSDSSASCTWPTAASRWFTRLATAAGTSGVRQTTDTPRPTRQGVLGITRITRGVPASD